MMLTVTLLDGQDAPINYPGVASVSFNANGPTEEVGEFVMLRCELLFPGNHDSASMSVIKRLRVDSEEAGNFVIVNVFPPIDFGDAFKVDGPPYVVPRIENIEFTRAQWSQLKRGE